MKPLWKSMRTDVKTKPFTLGDGVNTGTNSFEIKDSELWDALNIDSRKYPALKCRDGRSTYLSYATTPKMLSQRNNQYLMTVDSGVWEYYNGSAWVTLASGISVVDAKTEDFSTGTNKFTIFNNGNQRKQWDGTTVTDLGNMPLTNKFTVSKGRVYALSNNSLAFSALNNTNDWATINDAGSITITNAKGPGTAITKYGNHVVVFTGFSIHELYGSGPSTFSLTDLSLEIGCVSDRSVKEVRGRLYWLGRNHIYEYGGGTIPIPVSSKVNKWLAQVNWDYASVATSGTDGRRYYLALPINGSTTNNILLVYDTELKNWYVEDCNFEDFVEMGSTFYGVTADGKIKNMISGVNDDSTLITHYAISKIYMYENIGNKKVLHRLNVVAYVAPGSTLNFSISTKTEGDNFTVIKTFPTSDDITVHRIEIPMQYASNVDWLRIKFSGTGVYTVHSIEKEYRIVRRA